MKPVTQAHTCENGSQSSELSSGLARRSFLGGAAAAVAATLVSLPAAAQTDAIETAGPEQRRNQAFQRRLNAATRERNIRLAPHSTNGDEDRYASKIANFSKALPHNSLGEVDLGAYAALLAALASGKSADFEAIPCSQRSLRLAVRTRPSQGRNRGSIPLGSANDFNSLG